MKIAALILALASSALASSALASSALASSALASSALASSALGLLSAWYWYRTSRIDPVPSWAKDCGTEPVIPEIGTLGWIAGFLEASQASSALNRKAALTTAAAVGLGALGNLLASWPIG